MMNKNKQNNRGVSFRLCVFFNSHHHLITSSLACFLLLSVSSPTVEGEIFYCLPRVRYFYSSHIGTLEVVYRYSTEYNMADIGTREQ